MAPPFVPQVVPSLMVVLGVLGGLGDSSQAYAQERGSQRIALLAFSGESGPGLSAALRDNLKEQPGLALIEYDEVKKVSGSMGMSRIHDSDYPKIASALQTKAFLKGSVRRQQRGWVLTVQVIRGADGVTMGHATWQGRTVRSLMEIRHNGYAKLAGYLTRAFEKTPMAIPISTMPGNAAGSTQATAWWQAPPTKQNWWEASGENANDSSSPKQDYHVLRVSLLGGIQFRSMEATVISTLNTDVPLEQRSYKSSLPGHAEFGIEAEFFPFAIPGLPYFPYIGLVGSFRHSLFLQGEACTVLSVPGAPCPPAQTKEMDTSEWELYGAVRGRVRPWGQTQYDPEFQAEIGLGTLNFLFNTQQLVELVGLNPAAVIPPFSYRYVHFGIGASYGVYPQWLTLALRTGYRLGLGVGDDALKIWGTGGPEGPDTPDGFIVELEGRSEAPYIMDGLYFGLRLSYFFFQTRFSGQPACVNPSDSTNQCGPGDPWPSWPEEGDQVGGLHDPVTDHYFRATLMIGYTWPPPFMVD